MWESVSRMSLAQLTAPSAEPAPISLWESMTHMGLPWYEFVIRGVIIYIFVLLILRLTGKRQVGQLAPFDLVLLLVLSNAVQNAMNGGDNSVAGGMISAVTLVALNYVVGFLTFKSKRLEAIIEGRPIILVHNGCIDHKAMNAVRMTTHELNASLRAAGCAGPHEVMVAILENGGSVSVIPKHGHMEHAPTANLAAPAAPKP